MYERKNSDFIASIIRSQPLINARRRHLTRIGNQRYVLTRENGRITYYTQTMLSVATSSTPTTALNTNGDE